MYDGGPPAICDNGSMSNTGSRVSPVISIIEDDESLRKALVGLLASMARQARGYGSAEEFLAQRGRGRGCVVTDIQLPGMNGIEMIRRLRERGDDVPVIVITARDEQKWAAEARSVGALCLLRKPFETQDLLDCLDRAVEG
jgi:FixJ family two-component response regulator